MTHIDYLKKAIQEQVQYTKDADLLDFILKLLITERRNDGPNAGVLVRG